MLHTLVYRIGTIEVRDQGSICLLRGTSLEFESGISFDLSEVESDIRGVFQSIVVN